MTVHSEDDVAGAALANVPLLEAASIQPGTRVLVRVDWNVPLHRHRVIDSGRIEATFPVLDLLLRAGARVAVATHLGYPGGQQVAGLRTARLATAMAEYRSQVTLLENLRFSPGEQANDPGFAAELATDQDLLVNEAFSCLHRPHASIVGLPGLLPGLLGLLPVQELRALEVWRRVSPSERALVVGGNKVADKLRLLEALAPHSAVVAVGGRVALPFLVLTGHAEPGQDVRRWELDVAARALAVRPDIMLPEDLVSDGGGRYADIGPATARRFAEAVRQCGAVLWSGPLGRYEQPPFDQGTAQFLRALGDARGVVLAGGGDTVAAARRTGLAAQLAHLCTGGGAMLTYLATGDLVGLAALRRTSMSITEKTGVTR